jgi:hypothetical protein
MTVVTMTVVIMTAVMALLRIRIIEVPRCRGLARISVRRLLSYARAAQGPAQGDK